MSRESNGTDVRDHEVAVMRAAGETQKSIAAHTGLSVSGVRYVLAKEQVQAMIEKEQLKLAALIPSAVENYEKWVNKAHNYHDKTDKEIAFRATTKVLESVGIVSGNQSVVVQNINLKNTIISPVMEKILEKFGESLRGDDVVDVDFEELEAKTNANET